MLLKARSEDVVGADQETRDREGGGSEGALVCAQCRNLVTSRASAISMSGSHAHSFANPHGFEFRIGCFADAPGCREVGERLRSREPDITRLLDRLEARGFITRRRERPDRRVVRAQITDQGLQMLRDLDTHVAALHARHLGHLGPRVAANSMS